MFAVSDPSSPPCRVTCKNVSFLIFFLSEVKLVTSAPVDTKSAHKMSIYVNVLDDTQSVARNSVFFSFTKYLVIPLLLFLYFFFLSYDFSLFRCTNVVVVVRCNWIPVFIFFLLSFSSYLQVNAVLSFL